MAIIAGLLAGWFVFSLWYHSQHPPTNEQRFKAKENRRKAAMFIGTTAASTGHYLATHKNKKKF